MYCSQSLEHALLLPTPHLKHRTDVPYREKVALHDVGHSPEHKADCGVLNKQNMQAESTPEDRTSVTVV